MGILFTPLKSLPLLWPSLAWLLGLVVSRWALFDPFWFMLPILLFLFWRKLWLFFLGAGLIVGGLTLAWQQQALDVDSSWLNQRINIQATIQDVRQTPQYTRLRLSNIQRVDKTFLAGKLDVYLYRNQQLLMPDMQVALTVKLHKPHNKKNPAYFDYQQYMFNQGVAATGSVSGEVHILNADISWLEHGRQKVRSALAHLEQEKQGVLRALLLADRGNIPLAIDDAFAASGATHLLAISGLHMGLVAAWGFLIMWWGITRREAWIIKFPVRLVALSAGMLLAFSYATLAGWPIPAQRAFLMLFAGVLAWGLRATQVPLNTMFAALIVITLFDPSSVLSVSLYLSFIATTVLLVWAGKISTPTSLMKKYGAWFTTMLWVSLLASLATLPLIGFIFERFPALGLIANALMVPLYALWVLPLALLGELAALLGFASVATDIFQLSGIGISWGNTMLLDLQTLPWGNLWLRSDMPWLFVGLAVFLLVAGLLWLKARRKYAAVLLVVSLSLYAGLGLSERHTTESALYVWDVGQGASSFLALPDFHLVVDVSGKRGSKYNGGSIAAQNIRRLGVLHADAVVLSHAQSDHAGGIYRLLANLNDVHEIWLADVPENHDYFKTIIKHHLVHWLKRGDSFAVKGGSVQVLWPPQGYAPKNSNNASLVLFITLDSGQTLLFGGDMEAPVEREILQNLQAVDIMLMPHHGSKTSSTDALVQALKPNIVVAQTGYKNHYGFPKPEVVQRYQDVGSEIYNTANGYVKINLVTQ